MGRVRFRLCIQVAAGSRYELGYNRVHSRRMPMGIHRVLRGSAGRRRLLRKSWDIA